jgi:hypothetical protein
MMEHWWIVWQMGRLRQRELLAAAARNRLLRRPRPAGVRPERCSAARRDGPLRFARPHRPAAGGGVAVPLTRS